jgi:hypothetical protein
MSPAGLDLISSEYDPMEECYSEHDNELPGSKKSEKFLA